MSADAGAMSLKQAIAVALESNPQIGQAIESREAIEFELRQAKGLYLPSVDLEVSGGVRYLSTESRRALDDKYLSPAEGSVVMTQTIADFGRRQAELYRQASRVDAASFRVLERSEFIALQVTREYLEYLLQAQLLREARSNVSVHQTISNDISAGATGGALTNADRQQARERVLAAQARAKIAEEELNAAATRFLTLVGEPIGGGARPHSVAKAIPRSFEAALGLARRNNPRVKIAVADIDAASAMVDAARADYAPTVALEGRVRGGDDIDGNEDETLDVQARVVMRWNLYRGGIKKANEQEMIRRESEQRMVLHQVHREVEEAVRISWDRMNKERELARIYSEQAATNAQLVTSYREQFGIGQRSLLDVLDAQNTRYNANVLAATAQYAALFSEFRILAATGTLIDNLGLVEPAQADAYARLEFGVPPTAEAETSPRTPSRQTGGLPVDLLAPRRK